MGGRGGSSGLNNEKPVSKLMSKVYFKDCTKAPEKKIHLKPMQVLKKKRRGRRCCRLTMIQRLLLVWNIGLSYSSTRITTPSPVFL